MPIRAKGYYKWEGQLKEKGMNWLPIFFTGIKSVFRKKRSKILFGFAGFPFLIFLIAVYVSTKPELKMLRELVKQIQTDALLFNTFFTFGMLFFAMIVLSLFAGAELISGDLRFKSFTLYLSRPISKSDYIKGKSSVVLFYLLMFSLVPGLLLIIAKIIFTGEFTVPLNVLIATIIFPIVVSLFLTAKILMFSALSANRKFVYIMFIAFYVFTNIIAAIFFEIFRNKKFLLFSIEKNIQQFGAFLFNTKPVFNAPPWISAVILIGLTLIFFVILKLRLNRAEV